MSTIDAWLRSVGLDKYVPVFEEQEITLEDVPHLTESDLDKLGLPLGPRRRLSVAIQAFSGPARASAAPLATPTALRGSDATPTAPT